MHSNLTKHRALLALALCLCGTTSQALFRLLVCGQVVSTNSRTTKPTSTVGDDESSQLLFYRSSQQIQVEPVPYPNIGGLLTQ